MVSWRHAAATCLEHHPCSTRHCDGLFPAVRRLLVLLMLLTHHLHLLPLLLPAL
jgi:hypothetical protein